MQACVVGGICTEHSERRGEGLEGLWSKVERGRDNQTDVLRNEHTFLLCLHAPSMVRLLWLKKNIFVVWFPLPVSTSLKLLTMEWDGAALVIQFALSR